MCRRARPRPEMTTTATQQQARQAGELRTPDRQGSDKTRQAGRNCYSKPGIQRGGSGQRCGGRQQQRRERRHGR